MLSFDIYAYFNGICAAIYLTICLTCGLQLCFGLIDHSKSSNRVLSRTVGIVLLAFSFSAVCYLLSDSFASLNQLEKVGSVIDCLALIGIAASGHILYANEHPTLRTLIILGWPFVLIPIIALILPSFRWIAYYAAIFLLTLDFIYYSIVLKKQARSLDDVYSNPDQHSASWLNSVIIMLLIWFIISLVRITPFGEKCYYPLMYLYMAVFVYFAYIKISQLGDPVQSETRKEAENEEWIEVSTSPQVSNPLQKELMRLMEEEKIYLYSDLSVDDVVKKLNTNTKYFSAMLHNDMHTSFYGLINGYRIEHAKNLLSSTDSTVEKIGLISGFNSRQSFIRTFVKFTGVPPTDWRSKH